MRTFPTFALAALVALALAGCTAGDDDPAPPNADPFPSQSFPPASSTSASTGPPTNSSTTSTSSTATYSAPARFPPSSGEASGSDGDFPGLLVNGELHATDTKARIEATANNVGERNYRVADGSCATPWTESLTGPAGTPVPIRQPKPSCPTPTLKPFPAHDFISAGLDWNGTLWDATSGTYQPAPTGTYTWSVTFEVYSGGSGASYDEHASILLEFEITVA